MPYTSNDLRDANEIVIINESIDAVKVITIIIIWYLIAIFGLLPPSIWPIIVPGKATKPITEILAIKGLNDLMMA